MLEIDTAARFEDQGVPDVVVDTSHVRWIATANDIDRLPKPLVSRMQVFHIEAPNAIERGRIARSMLRSLVTKLGIAFSDALPGEVEAELLALSPRTVKATLEVAVGLAIARGTSSLTLDAWRLAQPLVVNLRIPAGFAA